MDLGYDQPLYILPFDHRSSFEKDLFNYKPPLTERQVADVAEIKTVVYDGFKSALTQGAPKAAAGILVDEEFGAAILKDAKAHGFITCVSAEKSGQAEFQFEYDDWKAHIAGVDPTFVKVLVRYNPEDDEALNRRQTERLHLLSNFVRGSPQKFMFELLVPMTHTQSDRVNGDQAAYDKTLRPHLMVEAIKALQDGGVEPDVWKLEGLDSAEGYEAIVAAARRDGRDKVGCIVLGRGSDEAGIIAWLKVAATVRGFIGFAVGRTSFWDALVDLRAEKITRDEAVTRIADRYLEWIKLFEDAGSDV
jgi:myo-inositol catabolism protein IolC